MAPAARRPVGAPVAPRLSPEEVSRLGDEIYERKVRPVLRPEDQGKYVAIDIATEEYEIDDNDNVAMMRLSDRHRGAQIWLLRVGKPVRMSFRIRFGSSSEAQ